MRHKALLIDKDGVCRKVVQTQNPRALKQQGDLLVLEVESIPEVLKRRPGRGHRKFKVKPEMLEKLKTEKHVKLKGRADEHIEKEIQSDPGGPPRAMRGRSGKEKEKS